MKKVYLLITAICLTALTGCIKEEPFKLEQVSLSVSLETRSGATTTQEQGDKIEDAMLWAFKCTLNTDGKPVVTDQNIKATGWRYVPNVSDTYKELANIHIPLDVCVEDNTNTSTKQSYVLFAVINTKAFDPNFSLGSGSSYAELTKAVFAGGEFWGKYPQTIYNEEGELVSATPEVMPVSNWATFTVETNKANTGKNTHPNNCYSLTLPVYRAVAKTQLYMRKSSADFALKVLDAKVVSTMAPTNGAMFTKMDFGTSKHTTKAADHPNATNYRVQAFGYPNQTDGLEWWQEPTFGSAQKAWTLMNPSTTGETTTSSFTEQTISTYAEDTYEWIASTFLFENDQNIVVNANYSDVTTDGGGYYMAVKYQVDNNDPALGYVPLPYVVRNHDYQVHATVDAGGKMTLTFNVQPWTNVPTNWNYTDVVTINENGKLAWTSGTYEKIEDSATEENVKKVTMKKTGDGNYTNLQCTFHIDTPTDATWYASFISGDINSFEFVGANSGTVGKPATLTIKAKNSTITSSQMANLDIVIRTADGRTLKSSELTNGVTYQLVQNE